MGNRTDEIRQNNSLLTFRVKESDKGRQRHQSEAHFLFSVKLVGYMLGVFYCALRLSFEVNSKNDTSAEQRSILVSETGVVIVQFIPKALGS